MYAPIRAKPPTARILSVIPAGTANTAAGILVFDRVLRYTIITDLNRIIIYHTYWLLIYYLSSGLQLPSSFLCAISNEFGLISFLCSYKLLSEMGKMLNFTQPQNIPII